MNPQASAKLDLPLVRGKLVRLAGIQGALLAAVLAFFMLDRPDDARGWRFLAAMALLPLLVATWGWIYWRALRRSVSTDGGTVASVTAANKRSLRVLGVLFGGWALVVALALFWP